jgi:hypothetical protein
MNFNNFNSNLTSIKLLWHQHPTPSNKYLLPIEHIITLNDNRDIDSLQIKINYKSLFIKSSNPSSEPTFWRNF